VNEALRSSCAYRRNAPQQLNLELQKTRSDEATGLEKSIRHIILDSHWSMYERQASLQRTAARVDCLAHLLRAALRHRPAIVASEHPQHLCDDDQAVHPCCASTALRSTPPDALDVDVLPLHLARSIRIGLLAPREKAVCSENEAMQKVAGRCCCVTKGSRPCSSTSPDKVHVRCDSTRGLAESVPWSTLCAYVKQNLLCQTSSEQR
jgi:hypothetical protein